MGEFHHLRGTIVIVPRIRAGANVALNNLPLFDPVNIAYELNLDLFSVAPSKWKVVVTDIFVLLEFLEGRLIGGDVFELPNLPELAAAEFFKRVIKQIDQKWIHVHDLAAVGIEDQDSVLSGFKQAAITQFGYPQSLCPKIFSALWKKVVR